MAPTTTTFNYHASWQAGCKCMAERGLRLLQSGNWFDCEFIVGEGDVKETFKAHKLILAMASEAFEAMLLGSPLREEAVAIPDINPEAFKTMLVFLYTDKLDIPTIEVGCDLFRAADKYLVTNLRKSCLEYLQKMLSYQTLAPIMEVAELFCEPKLQTRCWQMVTSSPLQLIASAEVANVSRSLIKKLLCDKRVKAPEVWIFDMVYRWSQMECKRNSLEVTPQNQREVIGDLLKYIHFLSMDTATFTAGPLSSGILTSEEVAAILCNIVNPGCIDMPKYLSKMRY